MVFEISAVIAVIIFAVLAFYLIRTLISLQHSLHNMDHLMLDMKLKMKYLDSSFQAISQLGEIGEKQVHKMANKMRAKEARNYEYEDEVHSKKFSQNTASAPDLVEWLLLSFKIGESFLKRK